MRLNFCAAVLLLSSLAFAQFKPGSTLITINAGPSFIEAKDSGKSLNTFAVSVSVDKSGSEKPLAGSIYCAYIRGQEDVDGIFVDHINYRTMPLIFEGKYLFGSPIVKAYANAGAGLQFSQIDKYIGKDRFVDHDTGIALDLGAGVNWFVNEDLALNASYRFFWLDNQYYTSGIAHVLTFGMSFQ